jgi:hypothetical protein
VSAEIPIKTIAAAAKIPGVDARESEDDPGVKNAEVVLSE